MWYVLWTQNDSALGHLFCVVADLYLSGIFIPLYEMDGIMKYLTFVSPLTYLVDSFHASIGGNNVLHVAVGILALLLFSTVFFLLSVKIHQRNMVKGL